MMTDIAFLVAFIKERNSIVQRMRVSNKQISSMDPSFVFREVEIRSISLESTSGFLIIINEVVQSPEGFKPKSARSEKRIIVYDVQGPKARYEIPTLNNIESVHAIKGSSTILFIIRSQAQNDLTFQLCSLDVGSEGGRRPTLRKGRTITSQSSTEERIGPTRLGGNSNQFIFCGLSSGAIAIWHALKPNISYGYFAPEVLLDKRLSSLSWKRGNDGSHCLAVAVRSSSVLRIWRGRKVVWGVADACGKLESAYKKTTRESLYLPFRPASTGVPRELEAAYRKITAESLYIPASLRVASREDNLSKLQSACEVILRDSPYFFSPSITMNSADVPESLHHAYERIANKSPYIIPPNTADFGLTVSKELVDAYQDIARDSIYFYPPSSRNFTPDVPEELEDYYERTLGQSPYISLPFRPNVP
ncbi:hypothetical protein D9756_001897 [Leucocoprinus leucothites]|uniref:Uncharacterized protein n=1 Tax=Leucocoprinus leucothites TaxID=201217 RepID=A0A8H5LIJ9_9AGAR|nr:hypothetical protein D9756_001897 [Leucoagaricus leucothites]